MRIEEGARKRRSPTVAAVGSRYTLVSWCATFWLFASDGHGETAPAGSAPKRPSTLLEQAAYPRQVARFGVTLPALRADAQTVGFHHASVVRAGAHVSDKLVVGAVANWTFTHLNLDADAARQGGADWYRTLLLAPALSFSEARWCLVGFWAMGYQGERWNRHAFRHAPNVVGCWAASQHTVYRFGAGMVWRPTSGQIIPYPILGWTHRGSDWTTAGLLPFWATVTGWLSPEWGLGGLLLTQILPYSVQRTDVRQFTAAYPALGPRAVFRSHGVDVGLAAGASLNAVLLSPERDFAAPRVAPFARLDVTLYENLLR